MTTDIHSGDTSSRDASVKEASGEDTITRRRIAMAGPVSIAFNQIYHFLRDEGYTVTWVAPQSAFEQVRWERPALIIINRESQHGEADAFMARLGRDPDTQAINVLVWTGASEFSERSRIETGLRHIGIVHAPLDVRRLLDQVNALATNNLTGDTQASLHTFVNQVIPDWATFLIAAHIGQNDGVPVNAAYVAAKLDLCEECVDAALVRLANAGYIEPIDWHDGDPVYAPVVDAEQMATLRAFGRAVMSRTDRLMLATLILARERQAA